MKPATSGKYQIGRAWVKEMPSVLTWFNDALKTKLFPTLHHLFGDLISSHPPCAHTPCSSPNTMRAMSPHDRRACRRRAVSVNHRVVAAGELHGRWYVL